MRDQIQVLSPAPEKVVMTTSTLDVGNLFSVLGAHGLGKQLKRVAGVGRVTVNAVSGATTVAYDPKKTSLAKIKAKIEECGFHCSGEALPKHVCTDHNAGNEANQKTAREAKKPSAVKAHSGHAGMDMSAEKTGEAKPEHKDHGGQKNDAMA